MKTIGRSLTLQVALAILLGAILGAVAPSLGAAMRPLGDGFIRLVEVLIAPVVFFTVVSGIVRLGGLRKVGRVGLKAVVVFEALTTVALVIGLAAAELVRPGAGMHVDPKTLDTSGLTHYAAAAKAHSTVEFLVNAIPKDVVDAFAKGDVLQVLLFSILFGLALGAVGKDGTAVTTLLDSFSKVFFRIVAVVMRLAPIGAFGAMAFTVGRFGLGTLASLGTMIACVLLTCALFIAVVLGLVMRATGLGLLPFLRYIRAELLIVLGTSSSESALPLLMRKLERLGCSKPVVGLVLPLGFSFNLVGTCLYLAIAPIFIAQATGAPLTLGQELEILALLLVTSKSATGITGAGFITLGATLSAVPAIPFAGLTLLLGIDRFLSEARALTNLIGNGVAGLAVSRWEGELDLSRARAVLADVAAVEREIDREGRVGPAEPAAAAEVSMSGGP